jgi:N-acetylglutamate synthase-like GNAT family acetyltransferase
LTPARDSLRKQKTGTVKIRKAKPSDKTPILEISKKIWGGHDYLPSVWDDWLRDKNARFIVATDNGRTVGCARGSLQTPYVAWLEGVRVHEQYRGLGIAGKLNHALVQWARRGGARVARLSTGSSNRASREHLSKIGFPVMGTFQRLETTKGLRVRPAGVTAPRRSAKRLWNWLKTRPNFAETHAMYSDGWTWYPLTLQTLRRLMRQGQVFTTVRDKELKACCIFLDEDRVLTMGFAAGERGDVVKLARMLRFLMSRKKHEKLRVLIPSRSTLVRALVRSGFEKTAKILVYEKFLG